MKIASLLIGLIALLSPSPSTTGVTELTLPALVLRNEDQLFKNSYALIIGESSYKSWPRLPGAEEDVKALQTVLRKQGFDVTVLMNPTRQEFDNAIKCFRLKMDNSNPSRFLFYFTGHGYTDITNGVELGYIVPSDAPLPETNETALKSTAISMNEMETLARIVSPSHVLFVFDSCFSGTLFTMMRAVPEAIQGRLDFPVRLFITAGTDKQKVPDDSVFRKAFINGIEGAANRNRDAYVTGAELGEYLYESVSTSSKGTQTPRYGKIKDPALDQGDFIFILPSEQREPFKPVSLGSEYYPSGWMGDIAKDGGGKATVTKQAVTIEGHNSVSTRIEYLRGNKSWAGIFWQHPDGNWGDKIGFSLVGAKKISFYAKGERGGEIVEFKAGCVASEGKPYQDRFCKTTNEVVLTTSWTKYTIDLSDLKENQLSSVIGGFCWVATGGWDKENRLVTYIGDLKAE